jgi:transcriptional regulator with XRE-family HTH domain
MEKTFAEALKEAGLTVAEFCRQTGTPRRTADQWVKGDRRTPPLALAYLDLYKKICSLS